MAEFTFLVAKSSPVPEKYKTYTTHEPTARALAIADVMINVLIEDMKAMVSQDIRKDIADSTEDDIALLTPLNAHHHNKRTTSLDTWLTSAYPFAHGYGGGHNMEVYSLLNQAVNSDVANIANGLPNPLNERITITALAEGLYTSAINSHGNGAVTAPLRRKGTALSVFRCGIDTMTPYGPVDATPAKLKEWIVNVIEVAIQKNKIMFIPWCAPTAAGGRTRTPSTWSWIPIDMPSTHSGTSQLTRFTRMSQAVLSVAEQHAKLVADATETAKQDNEMAAWSALEKPLCFLGTHIRRRIPPKEFDIKYAAVKAPKSDDEPDVNHALYTWLVDELNLYDPIHQLALYIAIMFSRIPPNISFPQTSRKTFSLRDPKNVASICEDIRTAAWIPPPNGDVSGKSEGLPYITLFVGYFLGLWSPNSPLPSLLNSSNGRTMRTAFNNKHHKKGITPFNLIRLGVAEPITSKAAKGGQFGVDWKFRSDEELIALHASLTTCFSTDEPFGAYDGFAELFGAELADKLVQSGQLRRKLGTLQAAPASVPFTALPVASGSRTGTAAPSGSTGPTQNAAGSGSQQPDPERATTTLARKYNMGAPIPLGGSQSQQHGAGSSSQFRVYVPTGGSRGRAPVLPIARQEPAVVPNRPRMQFAAAGSSSQGERRQDIVGAGRVVPRAPAVPSSLRTSDQVQSRASVMPPPPVPVRTSTLHGGAKRKRREDEMERSTGTWLSVVVQ